MVVLGNTEDVTFIHSSPYKANSEQHQQTILSQVHTSDNFFYLQYKTQWHNFL